MKWITIIVLGGLCQQDSTTDAGVHRSALLMRSHRLPKPEEIRVYDFVNYHRHEEIPEPVKPERVTLDARLLRPTLPKGKAQAFLQVGIRTPSPRRDRDAGPVNLCLVIDRSGSMSGENKMGRLKQGLRLFCDALVEGDLLSIVTFDHEVSVLRAAAPVSDGEPLADLIDAIQPGGGTNLHGGLMAGYAEVRRNHHLPRAHKVILLSDGQANAGVTDLERIVSDSKAVNDQGIALSTVGLGLSYNDRLMSQLAAAGKGTYHFLDSAEGIERTFLRELNSLLGKVGRDPVLRVTLPPGVSLRRVYGYDYSMPAPATCEFKLLHLPLGLTQIVPMELEVAPGVERLAEARLVYLDEASKREVTLTAEAKVERKDGDSPADLRVQKNLSIARLAQAFRVACVLAERREPDEARDRLDDALRAAETLLGPADPVADKDLARILGLVRRAHEILR